MKGVYYLPELINTYYKNNIWRESGGQGYYYNTFGNGYTEFFIFQTGEYEWNNEYNNNVIWNYQDTI